VQRQRLLTGKQRCPDESTAQAYRSARRKENIHTTGPEVRTARTKASALCSAKRPARSQGRSKEGRVEGLNERWDVGEGYVPATGSTPLTHIMTVAGTRRLLTAAAATTSDKPVTATPCPPRATHRGKDCQSAVAHDVMARWRDVP